MEKTFLGDRKLINHQILVLNHVKKKEEKIKKKPGLKMCIRDRVMAQQHMLDRVRTKFTALLNGYLPVPDAVSYTHLELGSIITNHFQILRNLNI